MDIYDEYDYRQAKAALRQAEPTLVAEVLQVFTDNRMELSSPEGVKRRLSDQIKAWFADSGTGWKLDCPSFTTSMNYDLLKNHIPMQIELSYELMVYEAMLKYLIDYNASQIPAGIIVVAGIATRFGHTWHCSFARTKQRIESLSKGLTVPIWLIGVNP